MIDIYICLQGSWLNETQTLNSFSFDFKNQIDFSWMQPSN